MKSKTLKVLEENIGIDTCGLWVEKNFFDKIKNTKQEKKLKIDKSDCI